MAFWTAPFSRGDSHASDACEQLGQMFAQLRDRVLLCQRGE